MHRISKLAAFALAFVLLLTSAAPASDRVLMRVGGSAASIEDYKALFGDAYPDDSTLALLAGYLRKLEDAKAMFGKIVPENATDNDRRMAESLAVYEITALRTREIALKDSAARVVFFSSHSNDFKWSNPHFIGTIVLAPTLDDAQHAADTLRVKSGAKPAFREVISVAQRLFGKEVRVIKYNVAQGENPFVDYAVFAGENPPAQERWAASAVVSGRVLTSPLSPEDAGELFVTVFADSLYNHWMDSLTTALPAQINHETVSLLTAKSYK